MKLKDIITTLRTIQFERIEVRDEDGNELFACRSDSEVLKQYFEYKIIQWFPHGSVGSNADFTVYVSKE